MAQPQQNQTQLLTAKELKELIIENTDEDLFRFSYDYVGDLAETISLLWESNNEKNTKIKITMDIT